MCAVVLIVVAVLIPASIITRFRTLTAATTERARCSCGRRAASEERSVQQFITSRASKELLVNVSQATEAHAGLVSLRSFAAVSAGFNPAYAWWEVSVPRFCLDHPARNLPMSTRIVG